MQSFLHSRRARRARALLLLTALALTALALFGIEPAGAEARTWVYINGRQTAVYFNDGDSFRILEGPYQQRGTRLAGFNTLESFGPTHQWGDWHPYELWVIAKRATLNAQRGIWHCTSDGSTDTYGRLLLDCPDLAIDQMRKGLAHAMNIDDTPSRMGYLVAQQQAIHARRGMWAHGVPQFILTSLHSRGEDVTRDTHYNRLVSTRDGHSQPWDHLEWYAECSWQCASVVVADDAAIRRFAGALRANPSLRDVLGELPNLLLLELVDRYARLGTLPEYTEPEIATAVLPLLEQARTAGQLGDTETVLDSCMKYTQFDDRFGLDRASCLRGRGGMPPHLESR